MSTQATGVEAGFGEEKPSGVWSPRPGHPGNLSASQQVLLDEFAKELEGAGALPAALQADSEQQEIILLRFLRARSWNVQHAKEMFLKAEEWKRSIDLDRLVETWEFTERQEVGELGWKMYFHKTDKLGRPIFIQDLSYIQTGPLFKKTTPERIINEFSVTLEKAVRSRYKICSQAAGHLVEDNLMILNVEGLGLGTFWSFKGQLQQLLGVLDANFPELSGRVQIINAPWIFATVWGVLKGWLPVGTVEKIDIQGATFKETLLQYADAESLPVSMGGTCNCPEGCWNSDAGPWRDGNKAAEEAESKATEAVAGQANGQGQAVGAEAPATLAV